MRKAISLFLMLLAGSVYAERPVTLGIFEPSTYDSTTELNEATASWLKQKFNGSISIKSLTEQQLEKAVKNQEIDAMIGTGGQYRRLLPHGVKDLATAVFPRGKDPNANAGCTIIVYEDNKKFKDIASLKGAVLAATEPNSFDGYEACMGEIAKAGFDPNRFFSKTIFTNVPMTQVVYEVLSGRADVGFLRSCYLEELREVDYPHIKGLRIIEPKSFNNYKCVTTSEPYAGTTFSITKTMHPEMAKKIVQALLEMPPTEVMNYTWTVASDFKRTDDLFRLLKTGPYSYLNEWTVKQFIVAYWQWILMAWLLIIGLIGHSIISKIKVKRAIAQVNKIHQQKETLKRTITEQSKKIQEFEKLGVVKQLSSIIAHELKQPLTSVGMYADSLYLRLKQGKFDEELFLKTIYKISELNQKSTEILEHVRNYAKQKINRVPINFSALVEEDCVPFEDEAAEAGISFKKDISNDIYIVGDKLELGLVITNLLKNAFEEAKNQDPTVFLQLKKGENEQAILTITNNGKKLNEAEVENISKPFYSSKQNGLGLGMTLVKSIVEIYDGKILIEGRKGGGLCVTVSLPVLKENYDERIDY